MAGLSGIPPPLQNPMLGQNGLVTVPWASYFRALAIAATPTGSGASWTVVNTALNYTAAYGELVQVDATGGPRSVTLPSPSSNPGQCVIVCKTDAGPFVVTVVGTINGASNSILSSQDQSITVVSTGTGWRSV